MESTVALQQIPEKFHYHERKLDEATTFFDAYFTFSANTELPIIANRWAAITGISALLGRNYWLPFGVSDVYPNIYTMLIGDPGARKSTAIRKIRRLVAATGYSTFAAEKTRQEKFLVDLQYGGADEDPETAAGDMVMEAMFGDEAELATVHPMFIVADEFLNFIGQGNYDFISLLGELYDFETGVFRHRLKNGKSVRISNPSISILSGNTHASFAECFPPQSIGQGFLSRLILVYCQTTGRRVTRPTIPDASDQEFIVGWLSKLAQTVTGPATVTDDAWGALDRIYQTWPDLDDARFRHYCSRRFTHLLKLCLITSASRLSTTISFADVILANSILTYTEQLMPKALGEFGAARTSGVASKVLNFLERQPLPARVDAIYKAVAADLNSPRELQPIIEGLLHAERIQHVDHGFTVRQSPSRAKLPHVDFSLLPEFYLR